MHYLYYSKKIAALTRSMKCLSPKVTLYLYKATIQPCMEYCSVLGGDPGCYLESLDKLQKRILGLLLFHLLPLLNPWFIIEMLPAEVFSIGINVVDAHLNWLNCLHFLIV